MLRESILCNAMNSSAAGRIERAAALELLVNGDLLLLASRADKIRRVLHPAGLVTFVVDRNVNYTNICNSKCSFCAFYRDKDAADAYILDPEQIYEKIAELVAQGGTQLLMQGGLNPDLKIDFFEKLFREIKVRFPTVQNHSLSPAEVICIAANSDLTLDETLLRLKNAGLDSIPGGGPRSSLTRCAAEFLPKRSAGNSGGRLC